MSSRLFVSSSVHQDQVPHSTREREWDYWKRTLIFLFKVVAERCLIKKTPIIVIDNFNLDITRLHYLVASWYRSGLRR